MASNYKVGGVDLDAIFEPKSTGTAAATGYKVAGADLNTLYATLAEGSAAAATGYKVGAADLNTIFAALGSLAATISPVGLGQANSRAINDCSTGIQFNTNGIEYGCNNAGVFNLTAGRGNWLDSGAASSVWVQWNRTSGATDWSPGYTGTNGVRLNLGTTRSWLGIDTNPSGGSTFSISGYFTFYNAASGGTLLATTTTATWSAAYTSVCPTCCFTPDTPITMANGLCMPIGDVVVGDLILTRNGIEKVSGIITVENRAMFELVFDDGRVVRMSSDHPLFVAGKGYAALIPEADYKDLGLPEQLMLGDKVTDEKGREIAITSITEIEYRDTVYTFENSEFYANGFLAY